MQLLQFIANTNLSTCNEVDRAKLLCFYYQKETGNSFFTSNIIKELIQKAGFNAPNMSRLKTKLLKGNNKVFLIHKSKKLEYEFIPVVFQNLEQEIGSFWEDIETVKSNSELLDETKFCGKYGYLNKLIMQINHTYADNCYDACAVLLRRLFEVLLILSFQHLNIDDEIKNASGTSYIMLDGLVKKAKNNRVLKLSRIKNEFDAFRMVGNFSAHNITYTAGKKDIDDIKLNYRVMLEELYNKAGLMA